MEGCLTLLLAPLGLFVTYPFLAFIPAALFLAYYVVRRPVAAELEAPGQVRWSFAASLAWIAYGLYEMAMHQWSKTVTAPIRADLFLLLPVLYLLTAVAVGRCVEFERRTASAPRGLEPVKPIRPEPYALQRNRGFVLGLAIILVAYPLLSLLFRLVAVSSRDIGGIVSGLLVPLALAFFLVQGHQWAKWCLVLWLAYSMLHHFIGWSSLRLTDRQDMEIFRHWSLVSLVFDVLLLSSLLFSRRLREYLDVRAYP